MFKNINSENKLIATIILLRIIIIWLILNYTTNIILIIFEYVLGFSFWDN